MTQYSHKSNNTLLAHTTRQSTSSSLRATWLTVSSPTLTVPAVDNAPSPDAECSLTLSQIHQCRRSPAMSSVRYPPMCSDLHRRTPTPTEVLRYPQISTVISVARSPLIYCPTAQTTIEDHHVVWSFAGHTCSRLPDNGRSPVIRDVALSEANHP